MKTFPINQRLASALAEEHLNELVGIVEHERTVFYDKSDKPVFAMTKVYDAVKQDFWYSYEAFVDEKKRD